MWPIVRIYYTITVRDIKGKIIKRMRRRSRSFLIQFLEIMYIHHAQVGSIDVTPISGGTDVWGNTAVPMANCAAGETEAGILVGTGTTAKSNTDYALATQIAHGTGSGQLSYGSQAFTQPAVVGANVDYVLTRTFQNGSGASITVNEIGFAVGEATAAPTTTTGRLIIRDVLAAGVAVGNGQTLTVEYTIRTTV